MVNTMGKIVSKTCFTFYIKKSLILLVSSMDVGMPLDYAKGQGSFLEDYIGLWMFGLELSWSLSPMKSQDINVVTNETEILDDTTETSIKVADTTETSITDDGTTEMSFEEIGKGTILAFYANPYFLACKSYAGQQRSSKDKIKPCEPISSIGELNCYK
jgi:hypothetical protein